MKLLCNILIFTMIICSYESISRQNNQCRKVIGGVRKSYAIDYSDVRSITVVNGGDSGATVTIEITNNYSSSSFGFDDLPYDIRTLCYYGGFANGLYDVNGSITNSVGSDSDTIAGGLDKQTGTVNGYACPTPPIITINPPVANMLPEPTIDDGCGCGLETVEHSIDIGTAIIPITSFPYDLTNLCGMGVDYAWRTSIELTTYARPNGLGGDAYESAEVATVEFAPENINPPYIIISVNGVSC